MFAINHRKNRTRDYTVVIHESDCSTAVVLAVDDVVRMKIGRGAGTPTLDISSLLDEILPGGSKIDFTPSTGNCTIRIAQADVASLETGAYDAEILVVDNSDNLPNGTDAAKHVSFGVFFLHGTLSGDIGDEESESSSSS